MVHAEPRAKLFGFTDATRQQRMTTTSMNFREQIQRGTLGQSAIEMGTFMFLTGMTGVSFRKKEENLKYLASEHRPREQIRPSGFFHQ